MKSFFPSSIKTTIADFFYEADERTRLDLSIDKVINERDYLSRWITLLEHPHGIRGRGQLPFRQMYFVNSLPGPKERKYGCDALLIFTHASNVKLIAIEGKYPRFHQARYKWDKTIVQTNKISKSHFSIQLDKQNQLSKAGVPVLEMFINHDAPNSRHSSAYLDQQGSSFVERHIAYAHSCRWKTWKQSDATDIIKTQYQATNDVGIRHFIIGLLGCNIGTLFEIGEDRRTLSISSEERETLEVPLLDLRIGIKDLVTYTVTEFMKSTGLRIVGYIQNVSTE